MLPLGLKGFKGSGEGRNLFLGMVRLLEAI